MRTISHPLFLVVSISYIIYYILKHADIILPELVTSYFADLVSLFIINTVVLFLIRIITGKKNFELPVLMVLGSVLLITLIFEVPGLTWKESMVQDAYDILCYLISGMTFLVWRRNWKLI